MADPMEPLRLHALNNVRNGTFVRNEDGSFSTVRSGSVNYPWLNGGKTTLIPFVWNGKIINNPDVAAEYALESGMQWPVFETQEEATKASKELSDSIRALMDKEGLKLE